MYRLCPVMKCFLSYFGSVPLLFWHYSAILIFCVSTVRKDFFSLVRLLIPKLLQEVQEALEEVLRILWGNRCHCIPGKETNRSRPEISERKKYRHNTWKTELEGKGMSYIKRTGSPKNICFSARVMDQWKELNEETTSVETVEKFKRHLAVIF